MIWWIYTISNVGYPSELNLFQGKVTQEEACIEDLKAAVVGPICWFACGEGRDYPYVRQVFDTS